MLLMSILVCVAALALLIAVPAYIAFATHNRLVALDQRCETAFGDIDAHLKHRHNLIPPLVETVRGFAKHESEHPAGRHPGARRGAAGELARDAAQRRAKSDAEYQCPDRHGRAAFPNSRPRRISANCEGNSSTPRTVSPPRAASTIWRSRNMVRRCANSPAAISAACSR